MNSHTDPPSPWKQRAYVSTKESSRTKRSRITRACDVCRRKKIRCCVDDSMKCNTCIHYGWECTFNDTAKKRGPPKGYIENLEVRLKRMEELLDKRKPEESEQPAKKPKTEEKVTGTKVLRYLGSSSGYYLVNDILSAKHSDPSQAPSKLTEGAVRFSKVNERDDDMLYYRPRTSDELASVELDSLEEIAPKAVIDALVNRFFELKHLSLPLIDQTSFLKSYHGKAKAPPSALLIHALCLHVCLLISDDDVIFTSHRINRDDFFTALLESTSELVMQEYLTPQLATIQALTLLCSHPPRSNSYFGTWVRAGIAVRMAQDMGLHRTFENLPVSREINERQKRLWYCVYITDRWCAAVMGRPMAISDMDCDIGYPQDDVLFVNFIRLSSLLGDVLRRIYSPRARQESATSQAMLPTVHSIHQTLLDWYQQLPPQHQWCEDGHDHLEETGPLMLCYHVVLILLYRFFLISKDASSELYQEAHQRCMDSAKTIIDIARLLTPADLLGFGWNFAGYAVFQATLIHVYNCTSSNANVSQESRRYVAISIEECIQPLNATLPSVIQNALPLIHTLMQLISPKEEPLYPAPMSVHSILSDWNAPNTHDGHLLPDYAATWQYLFSSAATPFAENSADWQTLLALLSEPKD